MLLDKNIDIKQALRVFQTIKEKGEKIHDEYSFKGLIASADFDGYNISINNDYVRLDIFFHNKYQLDYSDSKALLEFINQLTLLDKIK